jgi:V8-like Glu-specific endopeptidase
MAELSTQTLRDIIRGYSAGFPELAEEVETEIAAGLAQEGVAPQEALERLVLGRGSETAAKRLALSGRLAPEIAPERIVAIGQGVRPILRIRDNRTTSEFVGPANASWLGKIELARELLDAAVPKVGRIELTNSELAWAGTGWLIAPGILVTNRHVVELFGRPGREGRFVFRPGLFDGLISTDIDFLEEEDRTDGNEHPIESILWVSEEDDVAFLRVRQNPGRSPLPGPIELAGEVTADTWIAAIGYPARDPSIRDQALVREIFGDVYDKKRLAPGKVLAVDGDVLKHDCSTLGGNSGSALIDFSTGKAVGLHHGGYLDDSANLAVPAPRLRLLLEKAQHQRTPETSSAARSAADLSVAADGETARFTLNIPVELVVRLGSPALVLDAGATGVGLQAGSIEQAVEAVRRRFGTRPDVTDVSAGFRFADGWITDERAIVISVGEKMAPSELAGSGIEPLPREFMGFGVDVRTAPIAKQLEDLGIDIAVERPARPAGYTEPPGFDDPTSPMALKRVQGRMKAIFHVSPDAGFPQLKAFFGRVQRRVTATMYEWSARHISNAIEEAMGPQSARLRMVTQKVGVGGDATGAAVDDMRRRIGNKFSHVWASVRGPQRLIDSSYHIKVASRDGKEFWLSSGNWKDSGQPNIDPIADNETTDAPLVEQNREWHVIIAHPGLAGLFQRYIEYDFAQAERFPLPQDEAPLVPDIELFVPIEAIEAPEAPRRVRYFRPLELDEELDVQPLLTPDRDARGRRQFMTEVTALIASATESILLQNQSFKYSGDDNAETIKFLRTLRDKQRDGLDVRIITRDANDFGRGDADQRKVIQRLKEFGFDTSPRRLRLQPKCHTKGIIVDSAAVVLGSHNLTNAGALFNRDASLIVRSPKVAQYFKEIFLYDWDNLTHNRAERRSGQIRIARRGESPPPGFRRVSLPELFEDE